MHKDRKTLQQNATFFKKGSVLSFVVNSIIRIENNRFYLPAQGDVITSEEIFTYIRPISDYVGCNGKVTLYRKNKKRMNMNSTFNAHPFFMFCLSV